MELTKKHKIMLPLIGILAIVLLWQVWDTFFSSDADEASVTREQVQTSSQLASMPATKPHDQQRAMQQTQRAQQARPGSQSHQGFTNFMSSQMPIFNVAKNLTSPEAQLAQFSKNQESYLRAINEYQLAEIQRKIAQTNAAIAAAKTQEARSMSEARKLQGDEGVSVQSGSVGSFFDTGYKLAFTGKLNNEWTATIKRGDKVIDLRIGTHFPDGGVVIAIDNTSVKIRKGDVERIISFNGITDRNLSSDPGAYNSNFAPQQEQQAQVTPNSIPVSASMKAMQDKFNAAINKQQGVSQENATPTLTDVEKRLLAVDSKHYTIQLLSTDNLPLARQFIIANNLRGKVFAYRSIKDKKLTYHLVFGQFATKAAADETAKSLPGDIKNMNPIVLGYNDVQADIKTI